MCLGRFGQSGRSTSNICDVGPHELPLIHHLAAVDGHNVTGQVTRGR
ncbi:MAG: hypothetical protein ACI9JL_001780 [Paracoccaceae bacterium]|jgi:hypothetical protein